MLNKTSKDLIPTESHSSKAAGSVTISDLKLLAKEFLTLMEEILQK